MSEYKSGAVSKAYHEAVINKKDKKISVLLDGIKSLRRNHRTCEDGWYSCPKSEDGCLNPGEGEGCTCGADKTNATIDAIISNIPDTATATPPSDAYDLAAQVWQNVMSMQWSIQAVADAIEKLYEAREAAKALETRP